MKSNSKMEYMVHGFTN